MKSHVPGAELPCRNPGRLMCTLLQRIQEQIWTQVLSIGAVECEKEQRTTKVLPLREYRLSGDARARRHPS
jgi:hypothetical protein